MILPEAVKLFVSQQGDVCSRMRLAQPRKRRRRHHRISQPIDAADEESVSRFKWSRGGHHANRVPDASRGMGRLAFAFIFRCELFTGAISTQVLSRLGFKHSGLLWIPDF